MDSSIRNSVPSRRSPASSTTWPASLEAPVPPAVPLRQLRPMKFAPLASRLEPAGRPARPRPHRNPTGTGCAMTRTRRCRRLLAAVVGMVLLGAQPALACGGLVGPGGTVQLARTTTLAGYHDGVEHSDLVHLRRRRGQVRLDRPLPGVPSDVRKGGEWTLQRLVRETRPQPPEAADGRVRGRQRPGRGAATTRVDALDITILRGGGRAVGDWAREHGFGLSVDAPEVLDFYAARSPVFMAASFDARRAATRGQRLGDGTPIHLTIPTGNPWVPLRILGLGHQPADPVQADLYLLTDRRPAMLPEPSEELAVGAPANGPRPGPGSPWPRAGRPQPSCWPICGPTGHGLAAGRRHVAQLPADRPRPPASSTTWPWTPAAGPAPPRWPPATSQRRWPGPGRGATRARPPEPACPAGGPGRPPPWWSPPPWPGWS